jgi:hypothetical protein
MVTDWLSPIPHSDESCPGVRMVRLTALPEFLDLIQLYAPHRLRDGFFSLRVQLTCPPKTVPVSDSEI